MPHTPSPATPPQHSPTPVSESPPTPLLPVPITSANPVHMSAHHPSSGPSPAGPPSAGPPTPPATTSSAPNPMHPSTTSPQSDQHTPTNRHTDMELDDDVDANNQSTKLLDAIRQSLLGPDAAEFADVILTTTDNVEIPACRALLAIRSPYFKKLFFLPFIEREQRKIPINLHSVPLHQVLHFAYTDSCPLLKMAEQAVESLSEPHEHQRDKSKFHPFRHRRFHPVNHRPHFAHNASYDAQDPFPGRFAPSLSIQNAPPTNPNDSTLGKRRQPDAGASMNSRLPSVNSLIELLRAADYVQMGSLSKRVLAATRELLESAPRMACAVFEALCSSPTPPADICAPLFRQAAYSIRQNPRECLGVPDVRSRIGSTSSRTSPVSLLRPLHFFPTPASAVPEANATAAVSGNIASCSTRNANSILTDMLSSGSANAGVRSASTPQEQSRDHVYPVCLLSERSLDKILSDPDIFTSETYLFEVLFTWATNGALITDLKMNPSKFKVAPCTPIYRSNKNPNNNNNKDKDINKTVINNSTDPSINHGDECNNVINNSETNPRWEVAKRLAERIDLERLKPSFIRDYVMRSGLVDSERLYKTFMQQALEAERGRPLFDNFRGGSRWVGGTKRIRATSVVGLNFPLQCPWLTSGRHEWSFRVIPNSAIVWLGVMGQEARNDSSPFFENGGGWAYATDGRISPVENSDFVKKPGPVGPKVCNGNIVRVVLNLTKSGTLTVIVDGSPKSLSAFKDLRLKARRFLPAVALSSPAEIELIGEKHHLQ